MPAAGAYGGILFQRVGCCPIIVLFFRQNVKKNQMYPHILRRDFARIAMFRTALSVGAAGKKKYLELWE